MESNLGLPAVLSGNEPSKDRDENEDDDDWQRLTRKWARAGSGDPAYNIRGTLDPFSGEVVSLKRMGDSWEKERGSVLSLRRRKERASTGHERRSYSRSLQHQPVKRLRA